MRRLATTEVIPSARRLVRSLRDIGYDISSALSDLVDNSIAAAATNIWIDTNFDGEGSWIRVLDDGRGMTGKELREAMRFGTQRIYGDDELGRFGLGLKSASLSQCRHLTVATRTSAATPIRLGKWDLDHIEKSDRWEVLRPKLRESPLAGNPLRVQQGTAILWQNMDRVSRYRYPDGRRAEADFVRLIDEIRQHLGMTFHRYITGETRSHRRVVIRINGQVVEAWDPFSRAERATSRLPVQRLRMRVDGRALIVTVRPYVLPAESAFSSLAAHRRSAGPRFWTRQQGFYFYRNDRLIQAGGWSRLRTQDEHTKLARIAVEIPNGADDVFELTVSKTQIRVPPAVRNELGAIASSVSRLAEEAYRRPRGDRTAEAAGLASDQYAALASLVRMVIDATDQLIARELADSLPMRARLIGRLRAMEAELLQSAATALGITNRAT